VICTAGCYYEPSHVALCRITLVLVIILLLSSTVALYAFPPQPAA